jgi:hypothetical protein
MLMEKCVPIHSGFWQYGFNATYTPEFNFRESPTVNHRWGGRFKAIFEDEHLTVNMVIGE